MMSSKGFDWTKVQQAQWLEPTDIVYYLAHKWRELGYKRILDLGSGLGRHSVFFTQQGFEVSALDISEYGIDHLKAWAEKVKLNIDIRLGDMLALPYENSTFDAVFSYHVISHTDTEGAQQIIREIWRVLKPGGEIYISFSSKDSLDFNSGEYPKADENTIVWTKEPEKDVPHFHVNREDLLTLLRGFDLELVRHTDYCISENLKHDNKYYYISGRKN